MPTPVSRPAPTDTTPVTSAPATAPAAPKVNTPPTTVQFTGAVFSDAGQPLPGATVSTEARNSIPAITNAEGFFLLPLPAGQPVRFLVSAPGHEPQHVELRAPEAEKNLVITLKSLTARAIKAARARRSLPRRG